MSPDERREVLEALLARVRQTAADRGLRLPQDLPARSRRHDGAAVDPGNGAPPSLPPTDDTASRPPVKPLVRFEFEEEITSEGDVDQIERMALMTAHADVAEATTAIDRDHRDQPHADGFGGAEDDEPTTPPPPRTGLADRIGGSTSAAPAWNEARKSVPIELDDLDSLGVAPGSAPPTPYAPPPLPPPPVIEAEPVLDTEPPPPPSSPAVEEAVAEENPAEKQEEMAEIELDDEELVSEPPPPSSVEPGPHTDLARSYDDDLDTGRATEMSLSPFVPDAELVTHDAPDRPATPAPAAPTAPGATLHSEEDDEPVPASSQRQARALDRPIDDALPGVDRPSEPPPESGEVESHRGPALGHVRPDDERQLVSHAAAADELEEDETPTPRPAPEETAEVVAMGKVDVARRPPPEAIEVATFRGTRPVAVPLSFGDILDLALSLGRDR